MRRRKNADVDLRRLERAAASGAYSDVAAYWLALLRSGKLPPPTYDFSTFDKIWSQEASYSQPWIGWTIPVFHINDYVEPEALEDSKIWQVQIAFPTYYAEEWETLGDPSDYQVIAWQATKSNDWKEYKSFEEAKEAVKDALVSLLNKYDNQKIREKVARQRLKEIGHTRIRHNPDDDLRKLQRLAARGTASDVLKYFAAAWRAGEEPKGVAQLVGTEAFEGFRSFRAPLQFWVFGNGWALAQYPEDGRLYYMLFKLSTRDNSSLYVDTCIGRWVDLDWRDVAKVERYTPVWAIAERGSWRLSEPEMLDLVANLRARPKDVVGFADRLGGA